MSCQKLRPPKHSGRWTYEEETYVEGLIVEFDAGLLPIAEGTTMRSFVAKMLNCNPKRVSKKYDGNPIYDGKSVYARAKFPPPAAEASARQENLLELELKFREALLTIQRVESRLQSLTGHMEKQEKNRSSKSAANKRPSGTSVAVASASATATAVVSKVQFPVVQPWQPSSAVSSLTDEEGAAMDADTDPNTKMEETSTVVAQVSQTETDEEAASRVLLQMNASKPRFLSSAVTSAPSVASTDEVPQPGGLLLKKLYESQAHVEAANNRQLHAWPAGVATNGASPQHPQSQVNMSSTTNETDQASLDTIVASLNEIRQRQGQQQTAATSVGPGQPNLQRLFSGTATTALVSPLRQPADTRQNLQELLQLIQQPSNPTPYFLSSANLTQAPQLGAFDLPPSVLQQILQQQASQSPQSVENLIAQALGGHVPPTAPAADNINAMLQCIVRQSSAASQQSTPQAAFQETFQLLLQSFLQAQHDSQVQQQAASTLQAVVNSLASQALSQGTQPQQEPSLDHVLAALVSQLGQNNVASQQASQQIAWPAPAVNETHLIAALQQSLHPSSQPPQAPKPPLPTPSDILTMQILLAQLQQAQQ
jgi:hypothetical protein